MESGTNSWVEKSSSVVVSVQFDGEWNLVYRIDVDYFVFCDLHSNFIKMELLNISIQKHLDVLGLNGNAKVIS